MTDVLRRARRNTFTLLEILAAMAVLSILLILLFSAISQVNKVWQRGLAGIERRQNDRALLDFIATELRFAVAFPALSGTNAAVQAVWQGVTNNLPPYQFAINPTAMSAAGDMNAQTIFWQAPLATANGNIAEIGYCVTWMSHGAANTTCLRRFFLSPDSHLAAPTFYSSPQAWISASILDQVAPADAANYYRGFFAENVYALWVRALDPYGSAILTNAAGLLYAPYAYDSRQGYIDSQGRIHPPPALPAMVEVALVGSDSRTSHVLTQAYPAGTFPTSPANFWSDVDSYVSSFPAPVRGAIHIYSTRIALSNAH